MYSHWEQNSQRVSAFHPSLTGNLRVQEQNHLALTIVRHSGVNHSTIPSCRHLQDRPNEIVSHSSLEVGLPLKNEIVYDVSQNKIL